MVSSVAAGKCAAWVAAFGLRWQSAAATALSQGESVGDLFPKRRRTLLAAAVQKFLAEQRFNFCQCLVQLCRVLAAAK
jgi:hypothetical protein